MLLLPGLLRRVCAPPLLLPPRRHLSHLFDRHGFVAPASLTPAPRDSACAAAADSAAAKKPPYRPPSSLDRGGRAPAHSDLPFDFRFSYTEGGTRAFKPPPSSLCWNPPESGLASRPCPCPCPVKNNRDAESRRGPRPPSPPCSGGGGVLRPALHRPARDRGPVRQPVSSATKATVVVSKEQRHGSPLHGGRRA